MCGIAGVFGEADRAGVERMTQSLAHRGPDHQGIYVGQRAALGNCRLAVIDLEHGNQPIGNEDASLHIVFNGEVYNHPELRRGLQARGHRLSSRCDTEAVLHLYEELGAEAPCRLRGDFAFAVWDEVRCKGFLARDHLGVKPLYYAPLGKRLAFASELTALLRHPEIPFELEPAALDLYLSTLYVPAPWTICRNVFKLMPGHSLHYRADSGEHRLQSYWKLPAMVDAEQDGLSEKDLQRRVLELLTEAVEMRLASDVPLGAFLSGGIDSSAIVALMRQLTAGKVRTFSIGYPEAFSSFNELEFSRLVARRYGTEHHELIVQPDIEETVHQVVEAMDEPLGDSSAVPTFLVSRETRRHVTVALSGLGGDEVFAGYPRHLGLAWQGLYRRFPASLRQAAARLAPRIPEQESSRNLGSWVKRFLQSADEDPIEQYRRWMRFCAPGQRQRLYGPAMGSGLPREADFSLFRKRLAEAADREPVDQALYADLATYLPDDLLALADRMSMAHSLEVRVPFCDVRLVEVLLRQPWQSKMGRFSLKRLLKRSLKGVLPPAVLRRRKQGFMIPVGAWMKRELRPLFEDRFSPQSLGRRGIFQPAAVQGIFEEHLNGSRRWTNQLWGLLVFQLWCEKAERIKREHTAKLGQAVVMSG